MEDIFDQQAAIVEAKVGHYLAGTRDLESLGSLIADLESLLPMIDPSAKLERSRMRDLWEVLEISRAVALDRRQPELAAGTQRKVDDAAEEIRSIAAVLSGRIKPASAQPE